MYVGLPPDTVKLIAPVDAPLQFTFVVVADNAIAVACVIVLDKVAVQLFASVTVTVYVPVSTFVKSCEVVALLHAYV